MLDIHFYNFEHANYYVITDGYSIKPFNYYPECASIKINWTAEEPWGLNFWAFNDINFWIRSWFKQKCEEFCNGMLY